MLNGKHPQDNKNNANNGKSPYESRCVWGVSGACVCEGCEKSTSPLAGANHETTVSKTTRFERTHAKNGGVTGGAANNRAFRCVVREIESELEVKGCERGKPRSQSGDVKNSAQSCGFDTVHVYSFLFKRSSKGYCTVHTSYERRFVIITRSRDQESYPISCTVHLCLFSGTILRQLEEVTCCTHSLVCDRSFHSNLPHKSVCET